MKKVNVSTIVLFILLLSPLLAACRENLAANLATSVQPDSAHEVESDKNEGDTADDFQVALANPAAVYCQGLGYSMVDRLTPAGMDADCLAPGEFQCRQWDFLAGRCGQAFSFCEVNGGEIVEDNGNIGRCLFTDGSSCSEFVYFQGDCQPGEGSIPVKIINVPGGDPGQLAGESESRLEEEVVVSKVVQVSGWRGYVVSMPSGAQFDDYVVILPEGEVGQFGIEGASQTVGKQIAALRDQQQPGKFAHFWGSLNCDVIDYAGCQLLVDHLRVDGAGDLQPPEIVNGWQGTIVSLPQDGPGAPQPDDAFVLAGDFPVHYGLDSAISEESGELALAEIIAGLRDSQQKLRLWGELSCGVPDAGGCHIAVDRIEAGDQVYELISAS